MCLMKCLLICLGSVFTVVSNEYPWEGISNVSLWLSSAAYRPTNYTNHHFIEPTEGFVPVANIDDNATDTRGYIEYLQPQEMIFVVEFIGKLVYQFRSTDDSLSGM